MKGDCGSEFLKTSGYHKFTQRLSLQFTKMTNKITNKSAWYNNTSTNEMTQKSSENCENILSDPKDVSTQLLLAEPVDAHPYSSCFFLLFFLILLHWIQCCQIFTPHSKVSDRCRMHTSHIGFSSPEIDYRAQSQLARANILQPESLCPILQPYLVST